MNATAKQISYIEDLVVSANFKTPLEKKFFQLATFDKINKKEASVVIDYLQLPMSSVFATQLQKINFGEKPAELVRFSQDFAKLHNGNVTYADVVKAYEAANKRKLAPYLGQYK